MSWLTSAISNVNNEIDRVARSAAGVPEDGVLGAEQPDAGAAGGARRAPAPADSAAGAKGTPAKAAAPTSSSQPAMPQSTPGKTGSAPAGKDDDLATKYRYEQRKRILCILL